MRANYKMQRLYLDMPLPADSDVLLSKDHAHYLLHVLRMRENAQLLVFNGRDGEWLAEITKAEKKSATIHLVRQERAQPQTPKLVYCFAPLKHARLDYMMQKAVEMGAGQLQPVITQYTQNTRINIERMKANAIEAAEQCGVLSIPDCNEPLTFTKFLDSWNPDQTLIFCDEAAEGNNPLPILSKLAQSTYCGLIIGPEGGFSDQERNMLRSKSFVSTIPLGPRILRADTAAVAALALIGATIGDWN